MSSAFFIDGRARRSAWSFATLVLAGVGLLGLLARVEIVSVPALRLDAAAALVFVATVYLLIRDWRLGLGFLGTSLVAYVAGAALFPVVDAALLAVGLGVHASIRLWVWTRGTRAPS